MTYSIVCAIETSIQQPVAGVLAPVQRGEDRRRRLQRRVDVGVAERVVGVGAAAGIALGLGDPRLGADDRGVGAAMRSTGRSTRTR